MKKISLSEIKEKLDGILENKISREDVSFWARELQSAQDLNLLEYVPLKDEDIIWDTIQFLLGVDLKDAPDEYLHNREDIQNFRNKLY